ncbi:complex I subunit 5 family protein [Ectothiorhodospira mobilis]|uniref:complex I subunit 5 family protein n=1 Tax=Ectothiorhodospira mobilis TaxID=195064 RepID=UPI003F6B3D08
MGATALTLVPLAPLLLALVLPAGKGAWRLTPLAVLPALGAVLLLPDATRAHLPEVLLGVRLALDPVSRGFLLAAALLWGAAAVYARGDLRDDPHVVRFHVFFLLAMAGNLGLVVAADAVVFYTFFALMSLASVGLVVHRCTAEAWRATWVYLGMAVLGELCLFTGLILQVHAVGDPSLERLVLEAPPDGLAVSLIVVGLGAKAGMVPLHLWLPLAHPAAPTPASAVLSGAMIKAGLLGWLYLIPRGEAMAGVGTWLLVAGLAGAWFGVLAGVLQQRPKTLLAYSSISQMGLMTAGMGLAVQAPELGPALTAALVFYVVHHGLAKGALFLGTGIARQVSLPWLLLGLGVPSLALAGLPLTSGAMAKSLLKTPLEATQGDYSAVLLLMALAAAGTAVLMLRFLALVLPGAGRDGGGSWAMRLPWLLLALAAPLLPWCWDPAAAWALLSPGKLWTAAWPLLLGVGVALAGFLLFRRVRVRVHLPEGDLWWLLERAGRAGVQAVARQPVLWRSPGGTLYARLGAWLVRGWGTLQDRALEAERHMRRWEVLGGGFTAWILILFGVLWWGLGG